MNEIKTPHKWVGSSPVRPDGVPKVTGLAKFGNDYDLPGMLCGKILRSPHAHAIIKSIDTSKAEALPGVKAITTSADFPDQAFAYLGPPRLQINMWHVTRNIMAREKALYEGHAVAAVAAIDAATADKALALIDVDYEILPHVIDVEAAMAEDAPLLFEDMITRDMEPVPEKPSNIAKKIHFTVGNIETGFAEADEIVEKTYRTAAVHQGYIEPHACLAVYHPDGQGELWSASQGHFVVRTLTSKLIGMAIGDLKVTPAEIGGAFGGKTVVYVEPVAMILSKKSSFPVKMAMTRTEVFQASGPTSGSHLRVKLGAKMDGTITAAEGEFSYQAGAFPTSPVMNGCLCAFATYNIANQQTTGYDVVCNRPKTAAYRAPGSPISNFAVESTVDILAKKVGMEPAALRLKNAIHPGDAMLGGGAMSHEGYSETVEAVLNHPGFNEPLGPNQGRGVASGYWFNGAGESGATVYVNADGTISVATGSPDVGGSRASMALMAAETLGVDYDLVRATVNDTTSVPYTHVTGGSRVTYASGLAVVGACEKVILDLRSRAAKI